MRRICLLLLATLIVSCGAQPTPTPAPPGTPDPVATTVASIKITLTAEAARMPSATPTDTPAPTATAIPTDTPTPTPLPPPRLEGQVLDATSSEPLAGAQVAANERETTTDPEGRFLFTDLAPGPYTVLVTSADHDPILSGIVDLRAGQQVVVDAALPAAGTGDYPRDPMASNQIDPAGAPTAQEAERLARLQGLQGEVVSIREVVLEGDYLVNYKKGDAIRSALATLNHPAWELVDETGQPWYIIRVCGNLAVVRAPQVEVPSQCVAQPNPVVTVGSQAVNAYTCPAESCSVALELQAGWHGVALECAPGCGWLRLQCPGVTGDCWVRRDWLQTWGNLAELPVLPVAVSGQIAFFSDRQSPDYSEIYLMAPDGTNQVRLTSDLRDPSTVPGRGPSVIVFRWSSSLRKFLFSTTYNGRLKSVDASGRDVALVTELAPYFDLSPDGKSIAICSLANDPVSPDLELLSLDGTALMTLTDGATREALGLSPSARFGGLAWSPDGNKIAFSCNDTTAGLCWINADGTAPERILAPMSIAESGGFAWSPDGRYLLFTTLAKSTFALHRMKVESHTVTTLLEDGINSHPFWSPDSKRIVLSRGYPNTPGQIWVMNADGTGLTQLTFEGHNCCPIWLP